jgi:hypothetical protein
MMPFNKNFNWQPTWFSLWEHVPIWLKFMRVSLWKVFKITRWGVFLRGKKVLLAYPHPVDFSRIVRMWEEKNSRKGKVTIPCSLLLKRKK